MKKLGFRGTARNRVFSKLGFYNGSDPVLEHPLRRCKRENYVFGVQQTLPILPYDTEAALWHGTERARLEKRGLTTPFVDGQIAAIAKHRMAIPREALSDALYVAIACVNGINYLLTWNCKHLAGAKQRRNIERVCIDYDYVSPIICTTEELLGGE